MSFNPLFLKEKHSCSFIYINQLRGVIPPHRWHYNYHPRTFIQWKSKVSNCHCSCVYDFELYCSVLLELNVKIRCSDFVCSRHILFLYHSKHFLYISSSFFYTILNISSTFPRQTKQIMEMEYTKIILTTLSGCHRDRIDKNRLKSRQRRSISLSSTYQRQKGLI